MLRVPIAESGRRPERRSSRLVGRTCTNARRVDWRTHWRAPRYRRTAHARGRKCACARRSRGRGARSPSPMGGTAQTRIVRNARCERRPGNRPRCRLSSRARPGRGSPGPPTTLRPETLRRSANAGPEVIVDATVAFREGSATIAVMGPQQARDCSFCDWRSAAEEPPCSGHSGAATARVRSGPWSAIWQRFRECCAAATTSAKARTLAVGIRNRPSGPVANIFIQESLLPS